MQYASVFFLHLPKTGGTTMRRVLDREYRSARRYEIGEDITGDIRAFRAQAWAAGDAPRLVQGHMSYGLHRFVPGPTTYVTLLREPLRRALSDYHYVTSTPDHPIYERVKDMGLVEYFESGITGQLSNGQVRLLSGDSLSGDPGVPSNRPMEEADLERARDNLKHGFAAVGVLERFDESILLFRRRLGWQWPFYVRENVTARPYRPEAVDPAGLDRIRELNRLDIRLYESVKASLDAEIAKQGAALARDRMVFQLFNPLWGSEARHLALQARRVGGGLWKRLRRT